MNDRKNILKRVLAFLVSGTMIISLCGCGKSSKNETENITDASVIENSETTTVATSETTLPKKEEILKEAPEAYLDAILIQINPSFLLFVNEREEVVRSEARNDDAKKMMDRVALDGRSVNEALTDIVNVSMDDGYLKPGGKVNITMVESFRTESDAKQHMKDLENVVVTVGNERNTNIQPETKIAEDVKYAQEQPQPGQDPDPRQDPHSDPTQEPDRSQPDNTQVPGNEDNPDVTEPRGNDDHTNEGGGNGGSGDGKKEGCPVCHGSGVCVRCNKTGYTECGVCHGTGKKDCSCDDGYDRNPCPCGGNGNCYRCNGSGEFEGKTCDVCSGNGKCKECGGAGRRKCNKCGGSGKTECEECQGSGKERCQGCHGSLKCEACGGSGLNPHK